ncbi:hypothetical protein K445DRAFT_313758 [Daldinia sp. EC12]|nr:hypothetical protein K445DRAFT_313758 [Daldinia sp. EC12]
MCTNNSSSADLALWLKSLMHVSYVDDDDYENLHGRTGCSKQDIQHWLEKGRKLTRPEKAW